MKKRRREITDKKREAAGGGRAKLRTIVVPPKLGPQSDDFPARQMFNAVTRLALNDSL